MTRWYTGNEDGPVGGPFPSKRAALDSVGATTAQRLGPGEYQARITLGPDDVWSYYVFRDGTDMDAVRLIYEAEENNP